MHPPSNITIIHGDYTQGPNLFQNVVHQPERLDVPVIKHNVPPPISIAPNVQVIDNEHGIHPETGEQHVTLNEYMANVSQQIKEPARHTVVVEERTQTGPELSEVGTQVSPLRTRFPNVFSHILPGDSRGRSDEVIIQSPYTPRHPRADPGSPEDIYRTRNTLSGGIALVPGSRGSSVMSSRPDSAMSRDSGFATIKEEDEF